MARETSSVGYAEGNPTRDLAELKQLYRTAPVGLCVLDHDLRYIRINELLATFHGGTVDEILGRRFDEVRPDRDPRVEPILRHVLHTGEAVRDVEVEAADLDAPGINRHWLVSYYPLRAEDGEVVGINVVAQDITISKQTQAELRRSEAELRRLTARLISDQELVARELARELHDDLSQRLAALAIDIGRLESRTGGGNGVARELALMKNQVVALSTDVHGISRRLHPSILHDLGLVAAIEAEASGFGEREDLPVRVEAVDVPDKLPDNVALCLYRIVQESLRNAAKHASASDVEIALTSGSGVLRLIVSDNGRGFDRKGLRGRPGLGLSSMDERARLVDGRVSITSGDDGTTIDVVVPLGGQAS